MCLGKALALACWTGYSTPLPAAGAPPAAARATKLKIMNATLRLRGVPYFIHRELSFSILASSAFMQVVGYQIPLTKGLTKPLTKTHQIRYLPEQAAYQALSCDTGRFSRISPSSAVLPNRCDGSRGLRLQHGASLANTRWCFRFAPSMLPTVGGVIISYFTGGRDGSRIAGTREQGEASVLF